MGLSGSWECHVSINAKPLLSLTDLQDDQIVGVRLLLLLVGGCLSIFVCLYIHLPYS